jgi:recombinase
MEATRAASLFMVSPDEEGDTMAKAAAGGGGDSSVADQLRALGMKGVLTTPRTKWAPSPDHYPMLKSAGGHLVPENVRLSHTWCNNRDSGWRTQIRTLLAKGKSLAEIAETLNRKGVPPAHGTKRWTAARVRKAYVS